MNLGLTVTKLREESPPAFAALKEWLRIYRATLSQAFVAWPFIYTKGILLGSGLESPLRKVRLGDLYDHCLADLEAELGPLYGEVFERLHGKNPLRFDSSRAVSIAEIKTMLDAYKPRWSYEFTLDSATLHTTPLFQIHRLKDVDGRLWHLKVIKPKAREKLSSALNALREIEGLLRPWRALPKVSETLSLIEGLRLKAQRQADLGIERRTLQRAARQASVPAVHPDFDHRDFLVTSDPTRMHADEVKTSVHSYPRVAKKILSLPLTSRRSKVPVQTTSFDAVRAPGSLLGPSFPTGISRSRRRV